MRLPVECGQGELGSCAAMLTNKKRDASYLRGLTMKAVIVSGFHGLGLDVSGVMLSLDA